ncbi:MAG: tyrosine-protein kinase family protein [Bulleidia sp.]
MPELQLDLKGVGGSVLDSLQTLRSSIMYSNDTNVISFTSTTPGEGKSVLSFYTAVSFASLEKKTLFIDCDMRKSHIHRYFGATGTKKMKGISEYITGQTKELIFKTNYPNLDVIPCGKCPPDPSGILSSEMFARIVNEAREHYEYVIIDTPPVTVAGDACIAGRLADGVIYVVRDNFVKSKDAKHCIDLLERSECRILGIVSNMVKKNNSQSYYYGNYGYYDHE